MVSLVLVAGVSMRGAVRVLELIASQLGAKAQIKDAGPIRFESTTSGTTAEREKQSGGEVIQE